MNYIVGNLYGDNNTLLELVGNDRQRCKLGRFKCKCGKIFITRLSNIISGTIKGCGCLRDHAKVHGLSSHDLYNTYTLIKSRCYCTTNKLYSYYGERGITMSEEFKNSPEAFINYIISLPNYDNRVKNKLTLDRIENNKGYERGNLRWATKSEQMKNRRRFNQYDGYRLLL